MSEELRRDDGYWARRLLVDALVRACPEPPRKCATCGWPVGGTGKYICPCYTPGPGVEVPP